MLYTISSFDKNKQASAQKVIEPCAMLFIDFFISFITDSINI